MADILKPYAVISRPALFDRISAWCARLIGARTSWAMICLAPASLIWIGAFAAPIAIFIAYGFFRTGVLDIEYVLSLDAYRRVLSEPIYLTVLASTLGIALATSAIVCLVAFAFSYVMTFRFRAHRELCLALITVSLFSGYLVRIYAWRTILGTEGVINSSLIRLGVTEAPLTFLLYSRFAVILVLVNILLPFAIIPLYASLGNIAPEVVEASRDLGAGPLCAVRTVVMPLAHRGVVTAFAFSFVLAAADYVTPQLVGGVSSQMVGNVIADQFGASFDWPLGSALGVVTTVCSALSILLFSMLLEWVTR